MTAVLVLVGSFAVGLAWAVLSRASDRAGESGPGLLPEEEYERLAG